MNVLLQWFQVPSCIRKCRCCRWSLFPIIIIGIRAIGEEKYGNRKQTLVHHTIHQHNTNTAVVILLCIMRLWYFVLLGLSQKALSHYQWTWHVPAARKPHKKTAHHLFLSKKPFLKWVNKDIQTLRYTHICEKKVNKKKERKRKLMSSLASSLMHFKTRFWNLYKWL